MKGESVVFEHRPRNYIRRDALSEVTTVERLVGSKNEGENGNEEERRKGRVAVRLRI